MAFPQIETGYKPEFALGALYQGINAANANDMANETILKQFLANQQSIATNPIEVQQKQQDLDAGQYKTSDEYQTGMRDTIFGQGKSNLAAGQTAEALQPFKQKAQRYELDNEARRLDAVGQIQQLDAMLGEEANPLRRMALTKERERITRFLKETPEFLGKRELRETGTDSAEYIAELRAEQARQAAALRARGGEKPPKTAEEGLVRQLRAKLDNGEIDDETFAREVSNIFNARNAVKQAAGTQVNPGAINVPGQAPILVDKPPQQQYTPNTTSKPQQTQSGMSVEKLQQMYPGIPVEKLREAYKKKFGEDLK